MRVDLPTRTGFFFMVAGRVDPVPVGGSSNDADTFDAEYRVLTGSSGFVSMAVVMILRRKADGA
ncbi:hypothetical protein FEK33_09125 [Nocardia asteroides NBRC 15531]|uniref:hypothetical protein n=1 Tax=Nocardia asteroides TaxID=1824 RepID=UPI000F835E93|nr:hypothetical protein [Nocardia asteroides]TLF70351.1 hypothetical protein FEK33_09125 [Nocardia asteroides NBRC 15531]UGT49881.1 hypothetical protein LT345_04595 [Nocardia asteroides]